MTVQPLSISIPDNGAALTTGKKFGWWLDEARDVQCVRATLDVPQTSGPKFTIDVKRGNGASIFATPLTIDNGQNTSVFASAQAVINNGNLALNEKFEVYVLQSSGSAKGLRLTLYPYVPDFGSPPPPPPPPPQTWQTIGLVALANGDTAPLSGYNMRQVLSKSAFAGITAGTKIRLTLKAALNAAAPISKLYVGQGAAPNAAALVPVTVGGLASFTIPANTSIVTDELPFTLDPAMDLIIPFEAGGPVSYGNPSGAWSRWGKYGGGSESGLLSVSGYAAYNWQLLISKVEVFA